MKKILIVMVIITNIFAMNSCSDSPQLYIDSEGNNMFLSDQKMDNIDNEEYDMILDVSIIQLIANPTEYHGKKIAIKGVGNLGFEDTAVYLCIDNWYHLATKNAIWINMNWEVADDELWYYINNKRISEEDAQKYNGKYVRIKGTFDMYDVGHRGLFSGGIYDITRFSDYSDINRGIVE
jgi:hypothetical protein